MQGYKRLNCYIAAQGPTPDTDTDFWRMIWEQKLPSMVMLTKCIESGKVSWEQNWRCREWRVEKGSRERRINVRKMSTIIRGRYRC